MNGILVVDKELGYTSRDIVNIVSREFGTRKVGHTGTLDPIATGVLVLCIGKALKVVDLITSYDKEYVARVRLGYETDTLDNEGKIVHCCEYQEYTREEIDNVLQKFTGKIMQTVPKYSAIKVNGKRLYEYARNGIEVDLPMREVEIYSLKLVGDIELVEGYLEFSIQCKVSKGTYIRSLIRDIGVSLGSYATMVDLRRIRQGKFSLDDAYTIEEIQTGKYRMLSIGDVLDMHKIVVDADMEFRVRNGQVMAAFFEEDRVMIWNQSNELLAIYEQAGNHKVKPFKVLK